MTAPLSNNPVSPPTDVNAVGAETIYQKIARKAAGDCFEKHHGQRFDIILAAIMEAKTAQSLPTATGSSPEATHVLQKARIGELVRKRLLMLAGDIRDDPNVMDWSKVLEREAKAIERVILEFPSVSTATGSDGVSGASSEKIPDKGETLPAAENAGSPPPLLAQTAKERWHVANNDAGCVMGENDNVIGLAQNAESAERFVKEHNQ